MNRHLASFEAPELTFDKIGSFSKSKGGVVFLTCTSVPEILLQMVDALRQDLEAAGCVIESDFKLHVTLGRVDKDVHVEADLLRELTESVDVPALRCNAVFAPPLNYDGLPPVDENPGGAMVSCNSLILSTLLILPLRKRRVIFQSL